VKPTDRPIIIAFKVVKDQGEVDPTFQLVTLFRLALNKLKQKEFPRLQFWVLRFEADGEHRLFDALVNLCSSHV
jgi:hypothetical protein